MNRESISFSFKNHNIDWDQVIPEIPFPYKVHEYKDELELIGYFVNFDGEIFPTSILEEFTTHGSEKLVNSNSSFLLFIIDHSSRMIRVIVDQAGTFSPYFAVQKKENEVFFSTHFGTLQHALQSREIPLSVDPDGLMTGVVWNWHPTTTTLFLAIKRLPSGCELILDFSSKKIAYSVRSLVDSELFLHADTEPYDSISEFAHDWIRLFLEVVSQEVHAIGDLKFGCDLSSGFDCTLVAYALKQVAKKDFSCYSTFSEFTQKETNVDVMIKFAQRHSIDLKMLDISNFFTFKGDISARLNSGDPYQIGITYAAYFLTKLAEDEIRIKFTGEGGDEIYGSRNIAKFLPYLPQSRYFDNIRYFNKSKIREMFTQRAVDFALSTNRFNVSEHDHFPVVIPETSGAAYWVLGEEYWNHDIGMITPFVDTRLVNLARKIPVSAKGKMGDVKQEILKEVPEIFDPEMFRPKGGTENVYLNFLTNQRSMIDDILNASMLDKMGIIDKIQLKTLFDNTSSILYTPALAIQFQTLIYLDWYLQKNNITHIGVY